MDSLHLKVPISKFQLILPLLLYLHQRGDIFSFIFQFMCLLSRQSNIGQIMFPPKQISLHFGSWKSLIDQIFLRQIWYITNS